MRIFFRYCTDSKRNGVARIMNHSLDWHAGKITKITMPLQNKMTYTNNCFYILT